MDRHLELDLLGILRQTKVPASLAWLSDADKAFILDLLVAGDSGLHKSDVALLSKSSPDSVLRITSQDYAEWQSNNTGQPNYLTLTWKGEDAAKLLLQIAKNENNQVSKYKAKLKV